MNRPSLSLTILFLLCAVGFAASSHLPAQKPSLNGAVATLPTFPFAQGWLGADDAYSIPLGENRVLWLFGDTFIGDANATARTQYHSFARNSIGISTCPPGNPCAMRYYWKDMDTAKPKSFFDSNQEDVWYWPLDGYLDHGTLYLALMNMRKKPGASKEDALGFEVNGTKWVSISNPQAPPDQWKMTETTVTDKSLLMGVSIFSYKKYLMLYSLVTELEGRGYMTVLRVKKDKLATIQDHLEYLGIDKKWHAGIPNHKTLMPPENVIAQQITEMSVRYHPAWKKWIAVSNGPETLTNQVVVRVADSPIGPWPGGPVNIFQFPEMTRSNPLYDKDNFCYASKEHIEFGDTKMIVTYTCNSFSFEKVSKSTTLYKPQILPIDLPPTALP